MAEIRAIGIAAGVPLAEDVLDRTWERYDSLPPQSTASMQRDIMAGRRNEFELQTGSVVRMGRQHGVPTPAHDVLYAVLAPTARVVDEHSLPSKLTDAETTETTETTRTQQKAVSVSFLLFPLFPCRSVSGALRMPAQGRAIAKP
jgi:ketopantoate reductase